MTRAGTRTHWGGTRSGWNQRGGSVQEHFRIAMRMQEDAQFRATRAQVRLADWLGRDIYRLWAEETWPGDTIEAWSWQEIYLKADAAWDEREKIYAKYYPIALDRALNEALSGQEPGAEAGCRSV